MSYLNFTNIKKSYIKLKEKLFKAFGSKEKNFNNSMAPESSI